MMLADGLWLALAGTLTGAVGATALARVAQSLVPGVLALDPATVVIATVAVLLTVVMASLIPARRVSRVDSSIVLRT